jgi:hypothetical protein
MLSYIILTIALLQCAYYTSLKNIFIQPLDYHKPSVYFCSPENRVK